MDLRPADRAIIDFYSDGRSVRAGIEKITDTPELMIAMADSDEKATLLLDFGNPANSGACLPNRFFFTKVEGIDGLVIADEDFVVVRGTEVHGTYDPSRGMVFGNPRPITPDNPKRITKREMDRGLYAISPDYTPALK